MRFVHFDESRLGLLSDDGTGVIDVTDRLGIDAQDPLLAYIRGAYDASEYADEAPDYDREDVELHAPIDRPGKVIAAPLNYEKHIEESITDDDIDLDDWFSIEDFGYFLKAPSSIVGVDDTIELPFDDRRVDHEIELAFVVAEDVTDVSAEEAAEKIFGYTILLDITVRGDQDRSNRKSYDTFTVVGPAVVTPDEVPDPNDLDLHLTVNGETRQRANTSDLVYACPDVVQYASIGATVEAGDVITTGTPEGVGPITDGDEINAEIESLGELTIGVEGRDVSFADVDVQKRE